MELQRLASSSDWPDTAQFLDALRAGDRAAGDWIVRQLLDDVAHARSDSPALLLIQLAFRGKVVGWLTRSRFAGDERLALEVWNDTLFRLWARIEKFDPGRSAFQTWVWNQAKWAALDLKRKVAQSQREIPRGRADEVVDESRQEQEATRAFDEPHEPLTPAEEEAVRRAMRRLAPAEQWLLRLRYVFGFEPVEIARRELAGRALPEDHVRVYIMRARQKLARLWAEESSAIQTTGRSLS
jgi:RNA polymerase sigma factor (sigma-70 family)